MDKSEFVEAMELIVSALQERGYDPYTQLYGYVTLRDPIYITSHNGARKLIVELDFGLVKQYVEEMKL